MTFFDLCLTIPEIPKIPCKSSTLADLKLGLVILEKLARVGYT